MIAPRVGTIWFPTPTNACAVASSNVLRLITAGMVRGRVTPRIVADGIASGAAGRGLGSPPPFPGDNPLSPGALRSHHASAGCMR